MSTHHRRAGFTLIELFAVVAIVSVGAAVLLPGLQDERERARRSQCMNNLKQLGHAIHNYHDSHMLFPPGIVDDNNVPTGGKATAFTMLLPFIEETALYNSFNTRVGEPPIPNWKPNGKDDPPAAPWPNNAGGGWSCVANTTTIARQVNVFFCPSNRPAGFVQVGKDSRFVAGAIDYGLCKGAIASLCGSPQDIMYPVQLGGCFTINSKTRVRDIRDGTSVTVVMGEIAGGEPWIATADHETYQPGDETGLDKTGGGQAPRPWGVDQGWAVAWMRSGDEDGPYPRGSILISANQHVGLNGRMDAGVDATGKTDLDFPAAMNPRLVRQARIP